MSEPPVNLSFKDLRDVEAAITEQHDDGPRPVRTNADRKYLSRSLRLNNNKIQKISSIHSVLDHFLAVPNKLAWLDLSFNNLKAIDPVLCDLSELRVLYLHGNDIRNLSEVNKLAQLQLLHTLTLHGNPIELLKGYRSYVIAAVPRLKKMDFSLVTREEQELANKWRHCSTREIQREPTPEFD